MNSNVITANNISEYISIVHQLNNSKGTYKLLYRGQNNSKYDIVPSLCHKIAETKQTYLPYESELIKQTKLKYPEEFGTTKNDLELLSRLQHYGIPTRLLDVTLNPLVALFFACHGTQNFSNDGEVIVFSINDSSYGDDNDTLALSSFYKFNYTISVEEFMKLNKLDYRVSHNMHTSGVERYIVTHRVPIWTQLPEHTPRQKAQAGSYLIFPNEIEFTLYTDQYYNSEETHCFIPKINALSKESEIVSKIIRIPKNEKNSFLLHLDSLGIDESTLFPDNLDIGCKRIKQRITLC